MVAIINTPLQMNLPLQNGLLPSHYVGPFFLYIGKDQQEVADGIQILREQGRSAITVSSPGRLVEELVSPAYGRTQGVTVLSDLVLGREYSGYDVLRVLEQGKKRQQFQALRSFVLLANHSTLIPGADQELNLCHPQLPVYAVVKENGSRGLIEILNKIESGTILPRNRLV